VAKVGQLISLAGSKAREANITDTLSDYLQIRFLNQQHQLQDLGAEVVVFCLPHFLGHNEEQAMAVLAWL
jgi:hypothetical protein